MVWAAAQRARSWVRAWAGALHTGEPHQASYALLLCLVVIAGRLHCIFQTWIFNLLVPVGKVSTYPIDGGGTIRHVEKYQDGFDSSNPKQAAKQIIVERYPPSTAAITRLSSQANMACLVSAVRKRVLLMTFGRNEIPVSRASCKSECTLLQSNFLFMSVKFS